MRPSVMASYGAYVSPLDFSSHELEPLQGADLWAYELRADVEHRLEMPQREMNISLRRLLRGQPHISFLWTPQDYVERYDAVQVGKYVHPAILCISPDILMKDPGYPIIDDPRPDTPDLPFRRLPLEPQV